MADRFTNINFYAGLIDGVRRPVAKNQAPDPGPVENPDPGGDGGGGQNPGGGDQGTGGDIGNPTGAVVTTLGDAPTITRKTHSQDIYVARSGTMSITYVASEPCTMLPKGGYEDMTVSYAANGYEMTLSWTCPADEAGDSTYIGVECHKYGGDNQEAISTLWDRLHVGTKVAGDIVYVNRATHPTIRGAARALGTSPGCTLIFEDGVYSDREDALTIGWSNLFQNASNSIAEGVYTPKVGLTTNDLGDSYQDYDISKFSVYMAETPMGIKLDRNTYDEGVSLYGNAQYPSTSSSNGFRSVIGVKALGFCVRNCSYRSFLQSRAIRTTIAYGAATQDVLQGQTPNNTAWTGDGTTFSAHATLKANFEHMGCLTNERLMLATTGNSYGSKFNTVIATNGCTQLYNEEHSQTFCTYPGNSTNWHNCYALDGVDFMAGVRTPTTRSRKILDFCFSNTNGGNNTIIARGCGQFRDARGAWQSNTSGQRSGARDEAINCAFWDRVGTSDTFSAVRTMISGGGLKLDGVTAGKNQGFVNQSIVDHNARNSNINNIITSLLALSPQWDFNPTNDIVIENIPAYYNSIGSIAIISNYDIAAGIIAIAAQYYRYTKASAKQRGSHYVTRLEEGSILAQNGTGARNIFIKYGRYGRFFGDTDSTTAYDGTGGKPYVNAISRTPWLEMREERQLYDCTTNGGRYKGDTGWATAGINPIDYMNRFGTTDLHPINCPPIEDIYGYMDGSTAVIRWRPVCPAYRSTITAYDIYVDGVLVAANQAKEATAIPLSGITSGTRLFNIVVKDPTYGDSGFSRTIYLTIP